MIFIIKRLSEKMGPPYSNIFLLFPTIYFYQQVQIKILSHIFVMWFWKKTEILNPEYARGEI